jgi:hypothetical protein
VGDTLWARTLGTACLVLQGLTACSDGAPAAPDVPDAVALPSDAGASDDVPCTIVLPTCPASPPSWSGQVQAIVNRFCGGCHEDGGIEQPQFDFSTYADVHHVFGPMLDQVYGCNMPPGDAAAMAPADQLALLQWLVCAAPDN